MIQFKMSECSYVASKMHINLFSFDHCTLDVSLHALFSPWCDLLLIGYEKERYITHRELLATFCPNIICHKVVQSTLSNSLKRCL